MNNDIKNTMKITLNSDWVTNNYPWEYDYLNTYFNDRYHYIHECLDTIHNSAFEYIRIIHCVTKYSNNEVCFDITNPVTTFNAYYYLLAKEILTNDDEIGVIIYNIKRIRHLNYLVPRLLYRLPIYPVRTNVLDYLTSEY